MPRKRIEDELSPGELPGPDGGPTRTPIGEALGAPWEDVPASLFVRQPCRFRSAGRAGPEPVARADQPPPPSAQGLPGPGLRTQTITSPFSDPRPLSRLEAIFARPGVERTRAPRWGGMVRSAALLTPFSDLMVKRVLLVTVIPPDETPVPVGDPTLSQTRTGRFGVSVGDVRPPSGVSDSTPRRTRDGPARFLQGFRGYLQADACSGSDRIGAGPDVNEVACWAHVRRQCFEARTAPPVLAPAAWARLRPLAAIETAAAEFAAADRRALRHRDCVPVLVACGGWLTEPGRPGRPTRPSGPAIASAESHGAAFGRSPAPGELSLDTNRAERMLRAQARGRRHGTFLGSDRGGRTAALRDSVTGTGRPHDLDPFASRTAIRRRLPCRPAGHREELRPDAWFASPPAARRKTAT